MFKHTPAIFLALIISTTIFAQDKNWYTYYYLNPQPDRFVEEVANMAKSGKLLDSRHNLATLTFLSQIMSQNPDKISFWIDQLNVILTPDNMRKVYEAAWLSNTEESKTYFNRINEQRYLYHSPPDILKSRISNPAQMDMLWSYFFATGKKEPIRRILTVLEYSKYVGSINKYKTSLKTKEDKQKAFYDAMFRAALWSLESNCRQHERVKLFVEKIFLTGDLSSNEKLWTVFVLKKIDPEKYRIKVSN